MQRVRGPTLWCAVLLLAAACSGEEAEEPARESFTVVDRPIVGIVPATGVDEQGLPVDPALVFPSDAPEITVVVQVGEVMGGSVEITWYRLTVEPAETSTAMHATAEGAASVDYALVANHRELLFTHTVGVESYQTAFSVGESPGTLEVGSYQVEATLEGETQTTTFDVRDPEDTPGGSAGSGAGSGSPASGDSGALAVPAPEAGGGLIVVPSPYFLTASIYSAPSDPDASIITYGFAFGGGEGRLEARATMGGTTRTRSFQLPGANVFQFERLDFNPCAHPGGSDLPGTMATFGVELFDPAGKSLAAHTSSTELGPDTSLPGVTINSSPPAGSRVEPGDEINLDATAQENREGPSWQTGLQSFQLIATPGGPIGRPQRAGSSSPQPCGRKQWSLAAQETYTVPDDAPPVIRICGRAMDFAGNFSDPAACNEYYTGEVWTGSFVWEPSTCPGCTITYNVSLAVADDGTTSGTATYVSCTRCDPPPQTIEFTARRTATAFTSFAGGGYPHQGTLDISGDRAQGVTTQTFSGITERYNWDLTCATCDA